MNGRTFSQTPRKRGKSHNHTTAIFLDGVRLLVANPEKMRRRSAHTLCETVHSCEPSGSSCFVNADRAHSYRCLWQVC